MRNTAAELAECFLIGTGIACVLIVVAGNDSRLSVRSASAHGVEGRRVWFANKRTAHRALAKMLGADRSMVLPRPQTPKLIYSSR